jgi:LysM repeat protein
MAKLLMSLFSLPRGGIFMRRLEVIVTALLAFAALFGAIVAPTAAQQGSGTGTTTYIVQPGDNLYRISLKFGLSVNVLAQANGIVNPDFVYVGEKLVIPAGAIIPTAAPGVTLVPTLGTGATAAATADAGIVPTSTPIGLVQPTVAPTATTAPPTTNPSTYTVQPGDNLYRISLKFNTNMLALMQLNNIANANLIYVGQVLQLPNSQPPAPSAPGAPGAPAATVTAQAAPVNAASNVGFSFGVVVDMNADTANTLTASAKDLGMGWVKLPVLWNRVEATKGNVDATALDAEVDTLSENNLKVMLTVYSAPDWARPSTAESGPPTDFNDYATFVGALATRYKGKVQAYEIWTEPNIRREWSGRPLSAASYVEMTRLAFTAIKNADPTALVVSAGLAPTGYNDGVNAINDRVFLRQAYTAGLASYTDAIGVHPEGFGNPPDSTCCTASPGVSGWFNDRSFYFRDTLRDYRDIMAQSSDSGTYLWATQFGWGSSDGVVADPNSVDQNFGFVKFTNQTQQAQYITRAYELARTLGFVGPMFLYNLNYCQTTTVQPSSTDFVGCYYSLLDSTGQQRPAYAAVKAAPK